MSSPQHIEIRTLPNGLTVIYEPMPWLASTAVTLSVPYGSANDPNSLVGAHVVAAEWLQRGAGSYNARELADYFDSIGATWAVNPGRERLTLRAHSLSTDTAHVFQGLANMVSAPQFTEEEFGSARKVIREELRARDDDYTSKLIDTLVTEVLSGPLGRSTHGTLETLNALTADAVHEHAVKHLCPSGAVLSVAGGGSASEVLALAETHFGAWSGRAAEPVAGKVRSSREAHMVEQTEQVHIALGWAAADPANPTDALMAQFVAHVLSGGMGARLFTEVREKRGLVYAVSASYNPIAGHGLYIGYAGTTPERAEETLTVYQDVVHSLSNGVTAEEFARAKTGLLANVVMGGESPGARAARLAMGWIRRGEVRTLEAVQQEIEASTLSALNTFIEEQFTFDPVIVTLGPGDSQ